MSSQAEKTINHLSHSHPLKLSNHQTCQSCSGCKLNATGLIYSCTTCNYFLHIKCAQMPQQITHPFDKDHVFDLLPETLYQDGVFICDACGKLGDGFSYHCKVCETDLHILCAAMPLSFNHHSHNHQLSLVYSPPYPNKIFNCDICNNVGSNHWLYRCNACGFDVHLDCRNVPAAPLKQSNCMQQNQTVYGASPMPQVQMQQPAMASRFAPQPPQGPHQAFGAFGQQQTATGVPLQNFMPTMSPMNQSVQGFMPTMIPMNQGSVQGPFMPFGPRQNNDHLLQLQRLLGNSSGIHQHFQQLYLQSLMTGGGVGAGVGGIGSGVGGLGSGVGGLDGGAGGFGGGLGGLGSDAGVLQHLFQGLSGLNNSSGGQNILQTLMGGGASGVGGGLDWQSLIGGGNGLDILGGNGVDILGGLGGLLGGFNS